MEQAEKDKTKSTEGPDDLDQMDGAGDDQKDQSGEAGGAEGDVKGNQQPGETVSQKAFDSRRARIARQRDALRVEKAELQKKLTEAEQTIAGLKAPDPDDFEYDDSAYQRAMNDHNAKTLQATLKKERLSDQASDYDRRDRERQQAENKTIVDAFYDQAEKLQVNDFLDAENKLRKKVGDNTVDNIILAIPDEAAAVVYRLGADAQLREKFIDMAEENPTRATAYLGVLAAESKQSPKGNTPPTPAGEVFGSEPGSVTDWKTRIDNARKKVSDEGGDISELQDLKAQARGAGYTG